MQTNTLNKINLFVFRLCLYVAFGCSTVYGQADTTQNETTKKNIFQLMQNKSTTYSTSANKFGLDKKSKSNKKKDNTTTLGTPDLFKPLRVGVTKSSFSYAGHEVSLGSGFVYYTLKNPLKNISPTTSNTLNIGFSLTANF